jgi:hypothetical protein
MRNGERVLKGGRRSVRRRKKIEMIEESGQGRSVLGRIVVESGKSRRE